METRERRALRVLARVAVWVVAVPVGLVGAGWVVEQGLTYRQHRLHDDRAHRVLDRWADAVAGSAGTARRFVPAGDLTGQDGDWEQALGDDAKRALLAGQVVVGGGAALPDAPVTGTVRWADGATAGVPLLDAEAAVAELRRAVPPSARDCGGCRPLEVTGAVLGSTDVATDHGRATAPAWRYTLAGTGVVVTRVAVSPADTATVPVLEDYQSPSVRGLVHPDGWAASADGRTITVAFAGADGPGSSPCGADYAGRAVESSTGVVLLVRQTSPSYWRQVGFVVTGTGAVACPAYAVSRTVDVRLDAPLRDRTVLDPVTGVPLPAGIPAPPG